MNVAKIIDWIKHPKIPYQAHSLVLNGTPVPQVLTPNQRLAIDYLDTLLVSRSGDPRSGYRMKLTEVGVSLDWVQKKPIGEILEGLKNQLTITDVCYMPRSIALVVDPEGNWRFVIGYYEITEALDTITALLFSDAMNRTNAARAVDSTTI